MVQSLKLSDLTGKIVFVQNDLVGESTEIDLENCAPGIYFVELSGPEIRVTLPLIKH